MCEGRAVTSFFRVSELFVAMRFVTRVLERAAEATDDASCPIKLLLILLGALKSPRVVYYSV